MMYNFLQIRNPTLGGTLTDNALLLSLRVKGHPNWLPLKWSLYSIIRLFPNWLYTSLVRNQHTTPIFL